jgi:hypothetical protein
MTRRGLMIRITLVVFIYALAIGLGCDLRFRYPKREDLHYVLYKDLVPLIVAIPAAWLAYCFQRRASYLQQLRTAWVDAVASVQGAIQLTCENRPSSHAKGAVLASLGASIDGLRGLSRGGKSSAIVALETIRELVEAIGSDEIATPSKFAAARTAIQATWDVASEGLLVEFDRVHVRASKPERTPALRSVGPTKVRSRLTTPLTAR